MSPSCTTAGVSCASGYEVVSRDQTAIVILLQNVLHVHVTLNTNAYSDRDLKSAACHNNSSFISDWFRSLNDEERTTEVCWAKQGRNEWF